MTDIPPSGLALAPVPLYRIALEFGRIGALSFGGGLTAWIYRQVVQRRRWLTDAEFVSGLALAQVLPGINVANLSLYVGYRLRGVLGAATAIASLLLVPFFAVLALGSVYHILQEYSLLRAGLLGIASAAAGLLLMTGIRTLRRAKGGPQAIVVAAIVVLTVGILRWPMIPVVACLAPASVAAAWFLRRAPDA